MAYKLRLGSALTTAQQGGGYAAPARQSLKRYRTGILQHRFVRNVLLWVAATSAAIAGNHATTGTIG